MALVQGVFLDRDGVVNRSNVVNGKAYAPRLLSEFRLLPGVREAIEVIKAHGARVVIVTNQPDINNGLVDPAVVEEMHRRLRARLPVDDIQCCPHSQTENCDCRKPKPGMILRAAANLGIDPRRSVMVGDRASDVVCGKAAGCKTVFLEKGYREPGPDAPDLVVRTLPGALPWILATLDRLA